MKIILLAGTDTCQKLLLELKQLLSDHRNSIECHSLTPNNLLKIQSSGADLMITINLSGFEFTTLTDGISYNLWNTKFVHFLLEQNLKNERYLNKPLSISMFFYCRGQAYMEHLQKSYPDLPYLEKIDGWTEECVENAAKKNAKKMAAIIYKTARKCGLPLRLPLHLETEFYFHQLKLDEKRTISALRHIDNVLDKALPENDIPALLSLIPYIESGKGKLAWEYKAGTRRLLRILSIIYLETAYNLPPFCIGCKTKETLLEKYMVMLFALRRLKFCLSEKSKAEARHFLLSANISPFAIHLSLQSELLPSGTEIYQLLETLYEASWNEDEKNLYAKMKESVRKESTYEKQ